jgi:hypothetical protein
MGIIELSNALGIHKSVVSRLVKKGMPTTSVDAAQEWREQHAKPRAKRGQAGTAPPRPKVPVQEPIPPEYQAEPEPQTTVEPPPKTRDVAGPEPDDDKNDPRQSLRRARRAEMAGYNELVKCQRQGGSVDDYRKANLIYIQARNNRIKAERDFRDWQRDQSILLYYDEARDIASRPHMGARNIIESMPKNLAPRLVNQPQKAIERTLVEWCDRLTEIIRSKI